MILRLSDSLARLLVVALAILLSAWLSLFAVRSAVARYGAESDTDKGLQLAVRLEPGNPDYWYLLGRYQQYNLEHQDSGSAEVSYKKAIALNPLHTDAWLELATAYELDGNFEEARNAYFHAEKSYPISADVSWRYGNFLLRQGDRIHAYTEMRRAIEADPHRAAVAFSRAYRSNPNVDEILQQLLPAKQNVYVDVINEALAAKQLAVAETVWGELVGLHPRLEIRDIDRLVDALLQAHDYAAASRVWEQGVATLNLPPLLQSPGSVLWDPSFESGIIANFFSWQFKPLVQGVSIDLDRSERLTGIQSLRLSFDGRHNPDLDAACIRGIVHAKTTYHFAGWLKTNKITTENGIEFRVFSPDDPKIPALKTAEFHGTLPWTLVEGVWSTGSDTHQVQVCVTREASDNPEVRISGMAWADEITLIPQPAGRYKP